MSAFSNYLNKLSTEARLANRAVIAAPSSGLQSGDIGRLLSAAITRADIESGVTVPRTVPLGSNAPQRGAPAVAGNERASIQAIKERAGYVEDEVAPDQIALRAARAAVASNDPTSAKQHHNGLGTRKTKKDLSSYGGLGIGRGGKRPSVGPAVASLIDRYASLDQAEAEAQIARRAATLFKQGYTKSSMLNVVTPPDWQARAAAAGPLHGFEPNEISGGDPPELSKAETRNIAQGYMRGTASNPQQAAWERAAARQPKSSVTGVRLGANAAGGTGIAPATGYAADSSAPDAISRLTAFKSAAVNDIDGDQTNDIREALQEGSYEATGGDVVKDPVGAASGAGGGALIREEPSARPTDPREEAEAGAEVPPEEPVRIMKTSMFKRGNTIPTDEGTDAERVAHKRPSRSRKAA